MFLPPRANSTGSPPLTVRDLTVWLARRPGMRRSLVAVAVAALALPGVGAADIGIHRLSKSDARPGEVVSVIAVGYLRPKPWRPMPVVMFSAAEAPDRVRVQGGFRAPRARRIDLRPPRYRVVGAITHWRARDSTGVNVTGLLRFRVPRVVPGHYVFALFCESYSRGPTGSLIVDKRLVLQMKA